MWQEEVIMNHVKEGGLKVAQLSDLHYAAGTLAEVGPCVDSAVTNAIAAGVQVAIFTGDSTDHKQDAHSPAFLELVTQVQRMANHCPVLLLQGTFSHEPPGMLQLFRFLASRFPIEIADRIGQVALVGNEWRWVSSAAECHGARLLVSTVPTVNKADLVASVAPENVAEAMGDVLAALMGNVFAPVNRAVRAMGIPTVLIGHGTVSGSMTEAGVPMAGLDNEFALGALYSAMCSATMLGHIHLHQSWEREFERVLQRVAYPGSIGRNHYGEHGEKGFLIWNVGAMGSTFEFVATPACRMIDFNFAGAPDLEYIRSQAAEIAGAFVRVIYEIDEEFASTVDRKAIREALKSAREFEIKGRVIPAVRQRAPGISRLVSIDERVTHWCSLTDNNPGDIVGRLALLQSSDPKEIAANFLKGLYDENDKGTLGSSVAIAVDTGDGGQLRLVASEPGGVGIAGG
jgi:DNA repair protein SbcD/Mre11